MSANYMAQTSIFICGPLTQAEAESCAGTDLDAEWEEGIGLELPVV